MTVAQTAEFRPVLRRNSDGSHLHFDKSALRFGGKSRATRDSERSAGRRARRTTVNRLGSRIQFQECLCVYSRLIPKRGISSDSFSDSYGDLRGSVGIELLSVSVAC